MPQHPRVRNLLAIVMTLAIFPAVSGAAGHETNTLYAAPVATHLVEADTEALYYWRQFAERKPPLILFSGSPLLQPIPDAVLDEAKNLTVHGDLPTLLERAVFPSSNPLLLPGSSLTMALQLDWLSELLWIVPLKPDTGFPSLDQFKASLEDTRLGLLLDQDQLEVVDGCFTTTLQSLPLRICSAETSASIDRPALVHYEMSYFEELHVNPVKTPLYETLREHSRTVRQQGWPALAVTISHGNVQGDISLAVRYLADELSKLLTDPARLESTAPDLAQRLDTALYLENMFQTDQAHDIYRELQASHPDNPHLNYLLYKSYSSVKEGSKALASLERAVAADPVYAFEYITLFERALGKGRPDAALDMLEKAQAAFPDNPFIRWRLAGFLASTQHAELAAPHLERLLEMAWSAAYYPGVAQQLRHMRASLPMDASADPGTKTRETPQQTTE